MYIFICKKQTKKRKRGREEPKRSLWQASFTKSHLTPLTLLIPWPHRVPRWPVARGSPDWLQDHGGWSGGWAWFHQRWWRHLWWSETWRSWPRLSYSGESLCAWPGGRSAWTSWSTLCIQTSSLLRGQCKHKVRQRTGAHKSTMFNKDWQMGQKV